MAECAKLCTDGHNMSTCYGALCDVHCSPDSPSCTSAIQLWPDSLNSRACAEGCFCLCDQWSTLRQHADPENLTRQLTRAMLVCDSGESHTLRAGSLDSRACKEPVIGCCFCGFILMAFTGTLAASSSFSMASCSLGSSMSKARPSACQSQLVQHMLC